MPTTIDVEAAFKALNEASQQIEQAVDQGVSQPEHFGGDLYAVAKRLEHISTGVKFARKHADTNFRLLGIDRRKMRKALEVSPAGLSWLIEHGQIPQPDCKVPSFEWRGAGKYTVETVDEGWSPEAADGIVAMGDELRRVYADRHNDPKSRTPKTL